MSAAIENRRVARAWVSKNRARAAGRGRGRARRAVLCLFAALALGGLTGAAHAAGLSLVGASRAEVEQAFGKPAMTFQKGDVQVLVFPGDTRIELRDGVVIHHRGQLAAADTAPGAGRIEARSAGSSRAAAEEPSLPGAANRGAGASRTAPAPKVGVEPAQAPVAGTPAGNDFDPEEAVREPGVPRVLSSMAPGAQGSMTPEAFLARAENGEGKPTGPPAGPGLGTTLVSALLHFGLFILVLVLAVKWVGLSFYLPDVAKVAAGCVLVREVLHAVGGMGGAWSLLTVFRIDELASFVALAFLLRHMKVVRTGLSALKIAFATKLVAFFLMLAAGLALTFAFAAVA